MGISQSAESCWSGSWRALRLPLFPVSLAGLLSACLPVCLRSHLDLTCIVQEGISQQLCEVGQLQMGANPGLPPKPLPERRFCCRVGDPLVKNLFLGGFLKTFSPKVGIKRQISNKVSRVRDFRLESRAMKLDGKETNYIFIFTAPTQYGISFNYECNTVVLTVPVTCHQWISQILSNDIMVSYCRSLKISFRLITTIK